MSDLSVEIMLCREQRRGREKELTFFNHGKSWILPHASSHLISTTSPKERGCWSQFTDKETEMQINELVGEQRADRQSSVLLITLMVPKPLSIHLCWKALRGQSLILKKHISVNHLYA